MVTLVAKSDVRHVEKALRTTPAENLAMIRDTVAFLVGEGRRVAPKAASVALWSSSSSAARRKNSVSLGLAPGQPPSM